MPIRDIGELIEALSAFPRDRNVEIRISKNALNWDSYEVASIASFSPEDEDGKTPWPIVLHLGECVGSAYTEENEAETD